MVVLNTLTHHIRGCVCPQRALFPCSVFTVAHCCTRHDGREATCRQLLVHGGVIIDYTPARAVQYNGGLEISRILYQGNKLANQNKENSRNELFLSFSYKKTGVFKGKIIFLTGRCLWASNFQPFDPRSRNTKLFYESKS